ncbi:MAG: helix-turn-helix domain-containing protein [Clostridia bacterium]|nr:helix-turn-helix domain-containing protein [Clostridia bacterium]
MITINEIQKRLREAIKNSGLTQQKIAKQLNVSSGTISKYMRIDKYPSLDTFANLCEILDVSADEILGLKK